MQCNTLILIVLLLSIVSTQTTRARTISDDGLASTEADTSTYLDDDSLDIPTEQNHLRTFYHDALGFRFTFDAWNETGPGKRPQTHSWTTMQDERLNVSFLYPTDALVTRTCHDRFREAGCDSGISIAFGGGAEVNIYRTSLEDMLVFDDWGFERAGIDSEGSIISEYYQDSIKAVDTVWVSRGRQDMGRKATYLSGLAWHGVRGMNYTGIFYSEAYTNETGMSGYAGLAEFEVAVVVPRRFSLNRLVISYVRYPGDAGTEEEDAKLPPQRHGEEAFYEIVASIAVLGGAHLR